MLKVNRVDAKTEGSLVILCSLYKMKFWSDIKIAQAICNACLHDSCRITKAASLLILDFGKEDSSTILNQMPKEKLLIRLKECKQPEVKTILLRVYALMVETPVFSEDAICDAYVKWTSNQEEVAQLFAGALQDYHVKNPLQAQDLFKNVVPWFFDDVSATKKSKAAGLLFIKKVCNSAPLLISEDLRKKIFDVKRSYENFRKKDKDVLKIIESAQELIDLMEKPGDKRTQSSKRKKDPENEKNAKRR